jgi:hypothetical protein
MNTTQLKRFATEARKILLQGVAHRMEGLGFDLKTGTPSEKPQLLGGGAVFMGKVVSESFYNRWMSLFDSIRHRGVRDVAEEAAYTWFNRLIAIRILSKQGFISPVLQYESEDIHIPLIVSEARHGRMPEMNERTRKELDELLNDDSKTNEQFALLIVAFCHSNPIINRCFGAITDYTELLLPQDILREGGYVDMLNHTPFISDEDYGSSTLIGWLYQFYISDRKDEVFAKKGKYDADEIAPATQIFTPEWIVEYMVQNTIGRSYLDNNPYAADDLTPKWKYLVDQEQRDDDHICHFDNLEELRFADLGCGSGHIVGYMFEVLFDLYLFEGYSRREAVEHILKENLTGVDIDQRAKQLATFALLLKACQKDKSFADAKVMPNILDMPDPFTDDKANEDNIIRELFSHFILGNDTTVLNEIVDAIKLMDDAKTLGSIMKFNISERTRNILQVRLEDYEQQNIIPDEIKKMMPYVRVIHALTEKYTALVMNPPYMGSSRFDNVLSKYVKDNYPTGKADLFSVFMLVAKDRLVPNGKYAMINMQSWMFLSSFEQLRKNLLETMQIDSMLHLGPHTFDELSGEVVQNTAFVVSNNNVSGNSECIGTYYRLVDGKNCADKERMFLENRDGNLVDAKVYYPNVKQKDFEKIPGCPIGYWVSQKIFSAFGGNLALSAVCRPTQGLATADNARFVRYWSEVSLCKIGFNMKNDKEALASGKKWFPCNKGGGFRKWYGNQSEIINWEKNGYEIKNFSGSVIRNEDVYFMQSVSWNMISSGALSFRYFPEGFVLNNASNCIAGLENSFPMLGYLSSKFILEVSKIINPTLNLSNGVVARFPYMVVETTPYCNLVKRNIYYSKLDWDAHETSWDFAENPLVAIMKQAEGEEPIASEDETDGSKEGNQWFATEKTMVSRHETDAFAAENRHTEAVDATEASSCDDRHTIVERPSHDCTTTVARFCDDRHASLQQPCNDITKPLYDDYNALVNSLQGLCHPADGVTTHGSTLELCVNAFEKLWTARFMQLHANEEELNRQFIDIYGLQDELTPDVPLNEITILQQGEISIE